MLAALGVLETDWTASSDIKIVTAHPPETPPIGVSVIAIPALNAMTHSTGITWSLCEEDPGHLTIIQDVLTFRGDRMVMSEEGFVNTICNTVKLLLPIINSP